jgi:hypothetical protein
MAFAAQQGRAVRLLCAVLAVAAVAPVHASEAQITAARYIEPTTRYAHGVLGDTIEHGALEVMLEGVSGRTVIRLPAERVFEDTEPRLVDVNGDGRNEVVVVEAHRDQGARLAVYTATGLLAATPYIGRANRWLAPVGVADLDNDGTIEIAYIDRPHLAKTLRVVQFGDGELVPVVALEGLTNHRIGERDIAGGLRDCGAGPEMIVARGDWSSVVAVIFDGAALSARDIGPHQDRSSFATALACK